MRPPATPAVSRLRHERAIIALHWLVASSIVALLGIGWYVVGIPRLTPAHGFNHDLHKSPGIVAAALILALIAQRPTHRSPPLPESMPGWERRAAGFGRFVLCLFMVLSVVAGYLTSPFRKFGPKLFSIPLPHWGWEDAALRERFATAHKMISLASAVLIAVHISAALKDPLVDRDGVFRRTLPRLKRE